MRFLYAAFDRLRDAARRRRWAPDRALWMRGEDLAHRFLQRQGMTVVARNYRPPSGHGEIDLVAWDGPDLVFVEVKARATDEFGAPERAIDADKRLRIVRAARDYTRRAGVEWTAVRFDVVSIVFSPRVTLNWQKDAFSIGPKAERAGA